jgi:hypothetical protein
VAIASISRSSRGAYGIMLTGMDVSFGEGMIKKGITLLLTSPIRFKEVIKI